MSLSVKIPEEKINEIHPEKYNAMNSFTKIKAKKAKMNTRNCKIKLKKPKIDFL